MDYSYIFRSAKIKKDSLEATGFATTNGETYTMSPTVSAGAFRADISLSLTDQTLTVHLFDTETGEKYALFDMPSSHGAFVASLREEVQQIIDEIRSKCFESKDLKKDYISWIKNQFGAEPDFPWPDTPDYCVFRCPNEKWFALVMRIKYKQLGLSGDEEVWVVNIKTDQAEIPNLIDHKSIFPAWHMNKKHWITVLLTAVTDFEKLCALTQKSYELVSKSKK